MGRRKGKPKENTRLRPVTLPQDEESLYDFVRKVAVLPSHIYLPIMDLKGIVDEFAKDNRYKLKDVSRLVHACKSDPSKIDNALLMLSHRSVQHPDTIHFAAMDEYSVKTCCKSGNLAL